MKKKCPIFRRFFVFRISPSFRNHSRRKLLLCLYRSFRPGIHALKWPCATCFEVKGPSPSPPPPPTPLSGLVLHDLRQRGHRACRKVSPLPMACVGDRYSKHLRRFTFNIARVFRHHCQSKGQHMLHRSPLKHREVACETECARNEEL